MAVPRAPCQSRRKMLVLNGLTRFRKRDKLRGSRRTDHLFLAVDACCTLCWSVAVRCANADVAQLAEHLICNQEVASSILAVSSVVVVGEVQCCFTWRRRSKRSGLQLVRISGGVPKWPTGSDCKSDGASLRRFESFPHHGGSDAKLVWAGISIWKCTTWEIGGSTRE